ncbi:ubiquitin domain protein [Thermoascus aurantiacus ATCC 26904]
MGCCLSLFSSRDDGSPYTGGVTQQHHADSASRAINSVPNAIVSGSSSLRRPATVTGEDRTSRITYPTRRRGQTTHNLPLSEHYNQPIRPHVWHSKRRTWTRAQLAREREEFFETRVTGRPEVWAALNAATSLMREGDFATAQGIIDAAGITVPTGDLCEGCYDESGALYRLPQCIVSDPENVVETASTDERGTGDLESDAIYDGKLVDNASEDELIAEEIERRREEKGKMSERDIIKVKARLSDRGGPDVVVSIGKGQSVGLLARKVQAEAGISGKQRVRIAYLGKILKENQTLLDQGWKSGHVVNALVVPRHSSSQRS